MADESASNAAEFTVSEISGALKRVVEDAFGHVRVRGEVSGYRGPHSSGHAYFALKDERARIDAVIWRGSFQRLRFKPEEGMEVIATGKLTTYPGSSKYQIMIETLEPAGAGALMALLEERKRKLAGEGLFDPARKRPLPSLPRVIGVVTSPTGAVIRDIIHRITDRFPVHVIVWPVRVQGDTCGAEVARAIAGFNALAPGGPVARPDLIIVARGGGSLEDLWGFNDEVVVRAAAASAIPLISAVGHETDWTLIDLAADMRAPTPTGAAEMAVPVKADLEAALANLSARLSGAMRRSMDRKREAVRAAARALPQADQLLALPRRRFDEAAINLSRMLRVHVERKKAGFDRISVRLRPQALDARFTQARRDLKRLDTALPRLVAASLERRSERLEQAGRLLRSFSYQGTLERGFALVRDGEGRPLSRAAGIRPGDSLSIEFQDGHVQAAALGPAGGTTPSGPTGKRKGAAQTAQQAKGQGELF
ncbi:MAG: exodeoxyribonuclease VII large subunit [Phyllobacteriaceae bacterium]|nr:exodeoxyribonuclease VII large subunit [Phyllobacteriaceae bacterium]